MDRKRVLFIEDNEHDRELYGKLLWYNGFDVSFAVTGREGLDLAARENPRLIVLDLHLPDLSGQQVCERIRDDPALADVPIVIMTARPRREFEQWAQLMGCAGLIEKPITPLELLFEVEKIIGRAPLPGEVVAAERARAQQVGPPLRPDVLLPESQDVSGPESKPGESRREGHDDGESDPQRLAADGRAGDVRIDPA